MKPFRSLVPVVVLALGVLGLAPAATAATAPPNAPTGLVARAEPEIPWWIRLDWTDNTPAVVDGVPNPEAETFIEVERCRGVGCTDWTNVFLGFTPGYDLTFFRDSDASKVDGATYSYRVRGRNDAGMSDWSDVATATTGYRAPASPTAVSAAYVGANSVGLRGNTRLTWQDNATTEVGYRVNRCDPMDCAATRVSFAVAADATSFLDTTVVDGREYWYSVDAVGAGAFDGFGPRVTHVAGDGYRAPTSVTAASTSSGYRLAWRNQVRKPLRIWRCDTTVCLDAGVVHPDAPWVLKKSLAAGTTTWTDRFVKVPGTTYVYRLQVVTAGVVSHPVDVVVVAP